MFSGFFKDAAEFAKYAKADTAYTINIGGTDRYAKNVFGTGADKQMPTHFTLTGVTCVAATKNPTAPTAGASTSAPLPVLTTALATLAAPLFW